MSSIKTKDREKLNFENLHKNPSETLTNYIIRRQRVYFKTFPGGSGYDPIAKCVWDTAIVGGGDGTRAETSIVFLISCGISKIVGMIFTHYGWGQKFTLNNPIEHLLDLLKFYKDAFEG